MSVFRFRVYFVFENIIIKVAHALALALATVLRGKLLHYICCLHSPNFRAIICLVACQRADKEARPAWLARPARPACAALMLLPLPNILPWKYYDDLHNFSAPSVAEMRASNEIVDRDPEPQQQRLISLPRICFLLCLVFILFAFVLFFFWQNSEVVGGVGGWLRGMYECSLHSCNWCAALLLCSAEARLGFSSVFYLFAWSKLLLWLPLLLFLQFFRLVSCCRFVFVVVVVVVILIWVMCAAGSTDSLFRQFCQLRTRYSYQLYYSYFPLKLLLIAVLWLPAVDWTATTCCYSVAIECERV